MAQTTDKEGHHFAFESLSFEAYIAECEKLIYAAHSQFPPADLKRIVEGNRPFYWKAQSNKNPSQAILFIHGLYDSPYTWQALAKHYYQKGYSVAAVLLPGHGTNPSDLMHVRFVEWFKAVRYAVNILKQDHDEVFLCGFSLGSVLALHQAYQDSAIKGLILIAPAVKTYTYYAGPYLRLLRFIQPLWKRALWYRIRPQKNLFKYNSFAANAGYEVYRAMKATRRLIENKPLKIPVFAIATLDDAVVSTKSAIKYFKKLTHHLNRMLIYTKTPVYEILNDDNFIVKSSYFPEKNILDYSHICLPIAPDDPYYGANGEYQDFEHYGYVPKRDKKRKKIFLGSISSKNLKYYFIQRLTYNPDFYNMVKMIDDFLLAIEKEEKSRKAQEHAA